MSTIGERLKAARLAKGLSPDELADKIETGVKYIESLEANGYDIDVEDIAPVCRALSISPAWLLGMTDKTPEEWAVSIPGLCADKCKCWRCNEAKRIVLASHGLPAPGRSSE